MLCLLLEIVSLLSMFGTASHSVHVRCTVVHIDSLYGSILVRKYESNKKVQRTLHVLYLRRYESTFVRKYFRTKVRKYESTTTSDGLELSLFINQI